MKKFEYKSCYNKFGIESYLNELGKEGWELIGTISPNVLFLKRELKDKKKKTTYFPIKIIPRDIIRNRVFQIIVDHLGADENEVTEDANLQNDLGADSLDHVEIMMKIEQEFNIPIPDADADNVRSVKDAIDILYKLINIQ